MKYVILMLLVCILRLGNATIGMHVGMFESKGSNTASEVENKGMLSNLWSSAYEKVSGFFGGQTEPEENVGENNESERAIPLMDENVEEQKEPELNSFGTPKLTAKNFGNPEQNESANAEKTHVVQAEPEVDQSDQKAAEKVEIKQNPEASAPKAATKELERKPSVPVTVSEQKHEGCKECKQNLIMIEQLTATCNANAAQIESLEQEKIAGQPAHPVFVRKLKGIITQNQLDHYQAQFKQKVNAVVAQNKVKANLEKQLNEKQDKIVTQNMKIRRLEDENTDLKKQLSKSRAKVGNFWINDYERVMLDKIRAKFRTLWNEIGDNQGLNVGDEIETNKHSSRYGWKCTSDFQKDWFGEVVEKKIIFPLDKVDLKFKIICKDYRKRDKKTGEAKRVNFEKPKQFKMKLSDRVTKWKKLSLIHCGGKKLVPKDVTEQKYRGDEKAPVNVGMINPLGEKLKNQKNVRKGSVPKSVIRLNLAQSVQKAQTRPETVKPRAKRLKLSFERINSSDPETSQESYESRWETKLKKTIREKDSTKKDAAEAFDAYAKAYGPF